MEKAIGATAEEIVENLQQHKHDINRLCYQANSIMHEINQDNVVLNYKNMGNGTDMYFVKVAVSESDAYFHTHGKWLRKALQRSGGRGGIFKSSKRDTKWIRKHQPDAFKEALKEIRVA